ncbi:Hypothetical predicted protein [Octopus vulgaris]|uniref:Copine C-terminal domain-containing protein n=1 Tax=Octopus vulgaris TaxID=6645 RepID=A0AA36FA63_OCTVU|nr:Hypothetical predicted protein [Octopus vulgaris]
MTHVQLPTPQLKTKEVRWPQERKGTLELMGSRSHIEKNGSYNILIVFTDGCFNDMQDFEERLPQLKEMPLSILIIGIGDKDFEFFTRLQEDYSDDNGLRLTEIILSIPEVKYLNHFSDISTIFGVGSVGDVVVGGGDIGQHGLS